MLSYTYAFQVDVKEWALSDQVLLTLYPPSVGELLMNIKLATPSAGNLRKLFLQPGQPFGWGISNVSTTTTTRHMIRVYTTLKSFVMNDWP